MKDLRQYLQAFDDARPRTVEILIAIRDKDALPLHCLQLAQPGRRSISGISTALLRIAWHVTPP